MWNAEFEKNQYLKMKVSDYPIRFDLA